MYSLLRFSSVLALICLGTGIAFGQLTYTTTFLTHLNGDPGGLAVADFNRDGKPDIAAIHGTTLSVFFNHGSGTFGAPHDTALASNAESVQMLAADVNRDGNTDLVIAQSMPQQISVLLGNGDGTFKPAITFSLVNTPNSIAMGDFNNDGKVDLAVRECPANSTDCDIAVYLGTGTGMFNLATVLPAPGSSTPRRSLVVTDFNRDGHLDIATAAMGGASTAPTMNFTVFFGNGNGTFKAPAVFPVPFTLPANSAAQAPTIVAADFNGDAVDDIGVETGSICGGSACGHSTMNIFLNNRSGGFSLKSQFTSATDEGPNTWRPGDLNNDLRIDLTRISAIVQSGSTQTWTNKDGIFTSVSNPFVNFAPAYAEVRDVTFDGRHDLIESAEGIEETDVVVGVNGNGTPNCPPPAANVLQAKLCTPGATTSSNTFLVKASGNSPVGVKRIEVWVDGVKRGQALNDQILMTLTLTTGSHQIAIVAVDQYVGIAKTIRTVNVQ